MAPVLGLLGPVPGLTAYVRMRRYGTALRAYGTAPWGIGLGEMMVVLTIGFIVREICC